MSSKKFTNPSKVGSLNSTTSTFIKEVFPELNFPTEVSRQIKADTTSTPHKLWDPSRKIWLVYTPEEWVRQHCVQYLALLGYSTSCLSSEAGVTTVYRKGRTDLVWYAQGKPHILVECKAPHIKLTQKTFNQAFNYNRTLSARWIWLTNGQQHLFWDAEKHEKVSMLPPL